MATYSNPQEESLDPKDWNAFRKLGYQMIDDMTNLLETIDEKPVWEPLSNEIHEKFQQPLPTESSSEEEVYQEFVENILPYPMGNIHPRFWAWVIGTGTPMGAAAEFLAAAMNPNVGGGDHVANLVEKQVLDWCKAMFHYPMESSGLLVSGGSMANFVGLTVARNTMAGYDIRNEGIHPDHRLTMYASQEVHSSVHKAVEILGMGRQSLRLIPTNSAYEIDLNALQKAIAEDRSNGCQPICVIGNAGTVNTGAFDNFNALADIASREKMWFHVDGAFGSMVALTQDYKFLVDGMERADSLAFDLHKWLYMPIEIGATLVRNDDQHYNAFTYTPTYLTHGTRGLSSGERWFADYGLQLSRGFRALKAWMSFKNYGTRKYGRIIQQNIEQIHYLAAQVEASPELELMAPVPSNIACFRFVVDGVPEAALDDLNREIIYELHEQGIAIPSYAILNDRYAIRVANTNHRSRYEDFDILLEAVKRIGHRLAQRSLSNQ